ncbi:MAG: hypothetical protein A2W90_23365 [Bacteroidetes bacterium GWF2_42_66]|nr:MAG: hypothetical protein A2W92_03175 [Bacteroidetes bacterium GWA2_42_15]OFY00361.1 MAG: hypothetical protein A2W89_14300 [Bacteroidetes bacterium GWE2_42_39]OFY47069.1 MAG: hypothetical protein A2W90_23365 [Bacteroidetes bacterium GWF2_42_66]HBL76764.1 hypothetical protein [Prolixibacteraceae bacterium]HCU62855.1 hypothetical protein [Prolixibacteraceae bacterium]
MKQLVVKTIFITVLLSLYCCSKDTVSEDTVPDDLVVQEWNGRIKPGAYCYSGWSGKCGYDDGKPENAWAKGMPTEISKLLTTTYSGREPIWGWRDDSQEIMEQQIDLAADNGIAFFSFCWYAKNANGKLDIPLILSYSYNLETHLFMKAKNNSKMEFCLLLVNDFNTSSMIVGTDLCKQVADFCIKTYFKHPRYLKVGGKPVFMIWSPGKTEKEGLDYLQEASKKAGYPGVFVVGLKTCTAENGFHGQTLYNFKPYYYNNKQLNLTDLYPFKYLADRNISVWNSINLPDMPYIPCLTSGWDRSPWEPPFPDGRGVTVETHFARGTPAEFEQYMESMADWIEANPEKTTKERLAMIYAWNEIGEGGWLVPCKDDPEGAYLKAIRKVVFGK